MHSRHILVVEDSDEDFETVTEAARRVSLLHHIVRATTGDEGLSLLRSGAGKRHALPLLLLLDLNTPGTDGRDVLREIRSEDGLGTLPIIVLSASNNPRDLNFCYGNGANAYHIKPVSYVMHLQILQLVFSYWLDGAALPS
jgi:two-component system, response regulator